METKILIVDDEASMRKSLANLLRREGYFTTEASGGAEAIHHLEKDFFDLLITDLKMEPMSGLELLQRVKQMTRDVEVIVVTAFGTIETAVEAMKLKAFDFITKPFQVEEILLRVRNAVEKRKLTLENIRLQQEIERTHSFTGIIGHSKKMQELFALTRSLADTDVTAIIEGETGTGKELIARAIHYNSPRRTKRFLAVNCGAFSETLLESELFGHEKGAFTGADRQRKGIFEIADGGTLFLDEIGETATETQVKLLRVLEERELRRVGGVENIKVDVRLVAATNRNLSTLVQDGQFRQDLYYRLNVFPLRIPPLRERAEDIPLLVTHFIEKHSQKMKKQIAGVTPEARALIISYDWPGNVRELENALQHMIAICKNDTLDVRDLPAEIRNKEFETKTGARDFKGIAREAAEIAEKRAIMGALSDSRGKVTQAAKALQISRATLQNKMKQYRLRNFQK